MKRILLPILCFVLITGLNAQTYLRGQGNVSFISDAPLERIEGKTNTLSGIVDMSKMTFAFKVDVSSFEGFNSPLQKEHFNEHYLETKTYPSATFLGTILINEDCTNGCVTQATCKGKFTIHGVTQVVTVPITLSLDKLTMEIKGAFNVKLSEYKIKIPKIVQAKIANEIQVKVDIVMTNVI